MRIHTELELLRQYHQAELSSHLKRNGTSIEKITTVGLAALYDICYLEGMITLSNSFNFDDP